MESLYNYQDIMKRYGVAFSSFANFDRKGLLPPATCKRAGCRFWSSEALAIFEQNCIDFVNARKGKQGKTFSFIKNGKVITQEK